MEENLTTARVPQEIFPNCFPLELFKFIFDHSNVISLMHLSATSHYLRRQVHDFFKSGLSDEAASYPEVRDSLARIGWTKDHKLWTCDCFKLMAGPGFTWRRLNERKRFSAVCSTRTSLSRMSTTAAGKTFVITSAMELIYWATPSYSDQGQNSPLSLISHKNSQIIIRCLSSYDHVLAFSLSKHAPLFHLSSAVSIYNPRTLRRITDIEVMAQENTRSVLVKGIDFAKDTMVVCLECVTVIWNEFQIWKINTKEPQENGIALLNTFSHRNSPLSRYLNDSVFLQHGNLCVNDRFIVIRDDNVDEIKVFQRNEKEVLIRQLGLGGKRLRGIALEKGQGDLIGLAFRCESEGSIDKLVVEVYSASRGDLVIKLENPEPNLRYMQWFGRHLVVVVKYDNILSMMSWQLGLINFLNCRFSVPAMRGCSCPVCGGRSPCDSYADCIRVDYRGITSAIQNNGPKERAAGSEVAYFQTWDSC